MASLTVLDEIQAPTPASPDGQYGERMRARRTGLDLYELQDVPIFAFDLHPGDTVRCDMTTSPPTVVGAVQRSGRWGIRFRWSNSGDADRVRLVTALRDLGATLEMTHHAILVNCPGAQYQRACDTLWIEEERGRISYETVRSPSPAAGFEYPVIH